jgi:hypothetical protein
MLGVPDRAHTDPGALLPQPTQQCLHYYYVIHLVDGSNIYFDFGVK